MLTLIFRIIVLIAIALCGFLSSSNLGKISSLSKSDIIVIDTIKLGLDTIRFIQQEVMRDTVLSVKQLHELNSKLLFGRSKNGWRNNIHRIIYSFNVSNIIGDRIIYDYAGEVEYPLKMIEQSPDSLLGSFIHYRFEWEELMWVAITEDKLGLDTLYAKVVYLTDAEILRLEELLEINSTLPVILGGR